MTRASRARVALLHGFTGSPASFSALVHRIDDVEAVAPPLVGHGARDTESVTGFDAEVDRLAALLRGSGAPLHLVGYSLGGRLALGLLVRHGALFSGATLVGAQPGLATEAERAERRVADDRWCRLLEERGISAFVDEWEKLPLFATQGALPEATRRAVRAERLAHEPGGLVRSLRVTGLGVMPSYWDALATISVPTTLVVGSADAKFTAIARSLSERMPRATVRVAEGAGHNVGLEQPACLAAIVNEALARAPVSEPSTEVGP